MAKVLWFPLYVPDYLADTQSLTTEQHGAYLLLLMAYWQQQGPLPDDDEELAAICRMPLEAFQKASKRLSRFFTVADGVWRHKRVDAEIAKAKGLIAQKSTAGKASAQQKASGKSTPVEQPLPSRSNETPTEGATKPQRQVNQSQSQSHTQSPSKIFEEESGKAEDDGLELPEFMRRAPPVQTRIVAGGFKQIGAGKRLKNPRNADAAMEAFLASHCSMDELTARNTVSAARTPSAEGHIEAARLCEKISRENKLGWFHDEAGL